MLVQTAVTIKASSPLPSIGPSSLQHDSLKTGSMHRVARSDAEIVNPRRGIVWWIIRKGAAAGEFRSLPFDPEV
jgi:hypothetical protein